MTVRPMRYGRLMKTLKFFFLFAIAACVNTQGQDGAYEYGDRPVDQNRTVGTEANRLTRVGDSGEPVGLTIHTENFAVVRDKVKLDVPKGGGGFSYDKATVDLEPTSVILLTDSGGDVSIAEQSYRNDVLSTPYLLSLFEGRTIDFLHEGDDGDRTVFSGRVVRSGYNSGGSGGEPIFQINGKMRFGLPGTPLFPDLGDGTLLKPRLEWRLSSKEGFQGTATVSYLTGGMGWDASYNLIMPEDGGKGEITGMVSIRNQTGREFDPAQIKLLAGEVRRVSELAVPGVFVEESRSTMAKAGGAIERESFDEYHVYSLPDSVRLRSQEVKQVEFLSSQQVTVDTIYRLTIPGAAGLDSGEGVKGKVDVVRRFVNNPENGLGVPLPAGIIRFYKLSEETPEFLGESRIDHTPEEETVSIVTGSAFDVLALKHRTAREDKGANFLGEREVVEAYTITITNRKKTDISVNVVEALLVNNWKILQETHPHRKAGAGEAQWDIQVPADSSVDLSYEVLYRYP